ncbi:MAG TPA: hypothetical protein DD670_14445 [Planctomycetaceae bacterium]|nr:hypothetical protein [Planctomycetaceae bacterium]
MTRAGAMFTIATTMNLIPFQVQLGWERSAALKSPLRAARASLGRAELARRDRQGQFPVKMKKLAPEGTFFTNSTRWYK